MNAAILAYIAIAYALSIALAVVIWFTGGHESPVIGLGYLSMFIPAATVLVVRAATGEGLRVGWSRFPLEYVPLALFLMPIVMHATMLPVASAYEGGLRWQGWLTAQGDGLYHTPEQRGWGKLTFGALAGRIAINAVVGVLIVSMLAFFEEVGWRAWLLPRLIDRMGARRAVVGTAVIWAFWHTPFALSGIQYIEGMSSLRTAISMPIGIIATGLIIGWLWVRTESIWIVSLAHGALNNWGQYAFKFMRPFENADEALILGTGGWALFVVGVLLVACALPSTSSPVMNTRPSGVTVTQPAVAARGRRRDD